MRKISINIICAYYIIAWITLPFFEVGTTYRVLAAAAAIIWLYTIRQVNPDVFEFTKNFLPLVALYIILIFVKLYFLGGLSRALSDTLNPIVMIVVYLFYFGYKDTDRFRMIARFAITCFLVVAAITVIRLIQDPRAARDAYTSWNQGSTDGIRKIGTYGFIMASSILAPTFLIKFTEAGGRHKLAYGLCFVLLGATVFLSGYSTAVIILVASVTSFFMIRKHPEKALLILLVWTPILIFLVFQFAGPILELLMKIFRYNTEYMNRLSELYRNLVLKEESAYDNSDMVRRMNRYSKSIREIIRNPIFGAATMRGTYKGGGHSEFLDTLGRYGLLTFILHVKYTISVPYQAIKSQGKAIYSTMFALGCVLLCIADPYPYIISVVGAIIIPYLAMQGDPLRDRPKSR